MPAVGKCVARARWERGLSQEALARRANVSVWLLRKVEQGVRAPTEHFVEAVSEALKVDVLALCHRYPHQ
ncbi:helix-turn-helix domain-containing protein [Fodinicola feengrottensis]|uniref:helix-turn-helix domain-containing protein n=1 Tax=Fodinicola feengrottensis TaxID=435914 RepID=UPI0036F2A98D